MIPPECNRLGETQFPIPNSRLSPMGFILLRELQELCSPLATALQRLCKSIAVFNRRPIRVIRGPYLIPNFQLNIFLPHSPSKGQKKFSQSHP